MASPQETCREAWGRVYGLGLLISPRHIMSEFYVTTQVSWGKKEGLQWVFKAKRKCMFFHLIIKSIILYENLRLGLPWWSRGHGLDPWSGKTLHTEGQPSPCATTTESGSQLLKPVLLEPVLRNKISYSNEKPVHHMKTQLTRTKCF